jgi:hypothetical protein
MVTYLWWEAVTTSLNPQAGGPPLVGCPRLLIQYIHSYPPYLQAVPPFATWGRAMPWWQGPTYHYDRDPLITVTGTHLSLWQGPTYHCDRDPRITMTGTHLSLWQGPTYHYDRDPLITVTGTHLSLWQGPTLSRVVCIHNTFTLMQSRPRIKFKQQKHRYGWRWNTNIFVGFSSRVQVQTH